MPDTGHERPLAAGSDSAERTALADYWRDLVFEIATKSARTEMSEDQAFEALWRAHPRWRFFKNLPRKTKLLDVGAGGGGLAYWRGDSPERWDIELYGVDLEQGEHSHLYKAWELVNLDIARPAFPGLRFSGFNATHLIQYLINPEELIRYMSAVAEPKARLYLEWPSPKTVDFPTRDEFCAAFGCAISTLNFFDNLAHKVVLEREAVEAMLIRHGFWIVEGGEIDLGDVAIECMARCRDNHTDMQTGLWYATGWTIYLYAERY